MGNSSSKYQPILSYYAFQKKIKNHLNNKINQKDLNQILIGYFISPEWIKEWKKRIDYKKIEEILDNENIKSSILDNEQKNRIENKFNVLIPKYEMINIIKKDNIYISNFSSDQYLQFLLDNETYDIMKIKKTSKKQVEYIFKKNMIIFFFKKENIIKIIIHCLYPFSKENKLINLTFYFGNNESFYNNYKYFFKEKNSKEILELFINNNILMERNIKIKENNSTCYIINEELNKEYREKYIFSNKNENSEEDLGGIKNPKNINFDLTIIASERGLDNVGATCYMNAILQCLANIKPITDYLLNKDNYSYLFKNFDSCLLTLEYIQVLIGLYCNESQKGSYSPDEFKKTISELNPLFQGVQANNSKDLKIHNKKKNIIEKENELNQIIDSSNEKIVLFYFIKNFKKTHCSVIGDYLYGVNKSVFICQNCSGITFNFNLFNILIFSLEETSNYFNLSYHKSTIPIINFDCCFKYMAKEEVFQSNYCQHCGLTGLSKYRETIYSLPIYLIIILDRGKGNIFDCHVQIPEIFDASNYIEIKSQNNNYELVGIVSHFPESGIGEHFIAFCKHNIDGKWRYYNDNIVTECQNDFLNKGTPYIVFYKKCQIKNKMNIFHNSQEIINKRNTLNHNENFNSNFYNNNMYKNNISNNNIIPNMNTFCQNYNTINFPQNINKNINCNQQFINNNNYNQQNLMMNNINNCDQNMLMNINNEQNINRHHINSIDNSNLSLEKKINELIEELNQSQKTITQLNNKIQELENKLKSKDLLHLNKIQSLQKIISRKDEELNNLKEKLQNNNINDNRNQNNLKIIRGSDKCVTFISNDENLIYGIPCSGDDIFANIEEILYREYPEYRGINNKFIADGKEILRFKSINDNNIGTGKPIILIKQS